MEKTELIKYLVERYEQAQISEEPAMRIGIGYSVLNKTFSIDIDGKTYILPFNKVADDPNIGDEKAGNIKAWAHK